MGAGMKTPYVYACIGAEVISVLICIILLCTSYYMNGERARSKRTVMFDVLVLTNAVLCADDACSWMVDGHPKLSVINWITTSITYILPFLLVAEFVQYLTVYINERQNRNFKPIRIVRVYVVAAVIATIIAIASGRLFMIENGVYHTEELYGIYILVNIFAIVMCLVAILMYRKMLEFHERIVAYIYVLIPLVVMLIETRIESGSFVFAAATVSIFLIYIMLQSDRMQQLEYEGKIENYYASHDELTRLQNRHAFEARLALVKNTSGMSGVIFADLNGLKYANDHFGHKAGDTLLIRFTNMISRIFRANEMYRISGDEFLCIMENVSMGTFKARLLRLEEELAKDEKALACIGWAYGNNSEMEQLVNQAEEGMYAQKSLFHEKFPELTR